MKSYMKDYHGRYSFNSDFARAVYRTVFFVAGLFDFMLGLICAVPPVRLAPAVFCMTTGIGIMAYAIIYYRRI